MTDPYREPCVFLQDLSWVKEMTFGPSVLGYENFRDYVEATAEFLTIVDTPVCSVVRDYWLDHLRTHGCFPPYKGDWRRKLAAVAGSLAVRERTSPQELSRYRYVGVTINEMTGIDMTGQSVENYLPLSRDELFRMERMLHDEARTCYSRRDYGNIEKGYMKAVAVNFHFADEKGVPRFNMTAGDISVPV